MAGGYKILWGTTSTGKEKPLRVDSTGKLVISSHDKGYFTTEAALNAAYPTASDGDYAVVLATLTFWLWDSTVPAWADSGNVCMVTSVFARTGAVVATADDYTWAQIDKTFSDLADLTTKSHTSLTDKGTLTHAQLELKDTIQTLADAATVAWNAALGNKAKVTLTANRVMGVPTNLRAGDRYVLYCIQDGTGSRTLALNNAIFKFPGGTEPVLSTAIGSVDIIVFEYDGTSLNGVANYAFS